DHLLAVHHRPDHGPADRPAVLAGLRGGFTLGNYLGVLIDEKLALGTVLVRLITPHEPLELLSALKTARCGVTGQDAQGATGPGRVLLTVVPRKELTGVLALIGRFEPAGFYSVEELQSASRGVFPRRARGVLPWAIRAAHRAQAVAAE